MEWIGRSVRMGILTLFLVFIALVSTWIAWGTLENDAYARRFFDGLAPVYRVIASRMAQWSFQWDCTYAVVTLDDQAPAVPPSRSARDMGWQYAFGGSWLPTPSATLGENVRDAVGVCSAAFPADAALRLQRALDQPGSWYVRDDVGETVFVYSIPQRIAARIRYGD